MRKNFKPQPYMYPQPVLIVAAYGEDDKANAMCVAWGTICDTDAVALVMNEDHKTLKNIMQRKAFTVSMATSSQIEAVDYMGMVSGNEEPDKIAKVGWHVTKSAVVDAPLIEELPMALECTVVKYDKKFECLYGKIKNISIDESVLSEDGSVDVQKLQPISLDPINGKYLTLGSIIGCAFSDGKKFK